MIGTGLDVIYYEQSGELFNLFTGKTVNYAAFVFVVFDVFDNFAINILGFRTNLVVEIVAVKRGFEHTRTGHAEVLLNVVLNLRRCRCRKSYNGALADFVDYGANPPIFGSEIMTPLRNAVRFVDSVERYLN